MPLIKVTDIYEVICDCGGAFTVRLAEDHYGCVRCCTEIELSPLWVNSELEDLDREEARLTAEHHWDAE